jgi:hypothetical protein
LGHIPPSCGCIIISSTGSSILVAFELLLAFAIKIMPS